MSETLALHQAESKPVSKYFLVLLVLATAVHFFASSLVWSRPIGGQYAFREAQTAMNTECFIRDGFRFDYELPVFGSPWLVPFEFPTYQAIVAAVHSIAGGSLETSARTVGLIFFYSALIVFFRLALFASQSI